MVALSQSAPDSALLSTSMSKTATAVASSPSTTTPASQACLNTTELLENILRFVDFNTLLLAQRVSHHFMDVITGSLPLQRKLFLAPATFQEALSTADGEDDTMMNWCAKYQKKWQGGPDLERPDFTHCYMVNPLLLNIRAVEAPGVRLFEWMTEQKWQDYFTKSKLPLNNSQSFLHMYLAHPMPETVLFEISVGTSGTPRIRSGDYVQVAGTDTNGPLNFGKLIANVGKAWQEQERQRIEFNMSTMVMYTRDPRPINWGESEIMLDVQYFRLSEMRRQLPS